jgi:hypothetical protein
VFHSVPSVGTAVLILQVIIRDLFVTWNKLVLNKIWRLSQSLVTTLRSSANNSWSSVWQVLVQLQSKHMKGVLTLNQKSMLNSPKHFQLP